MKVFIEFLIIYILGFIIGASIVYKIELNQAITNGHFKFNGQTYYVQKGENSKWLIL